MLPGTFQGVVQHRERADLGFWLTPRLADAIVARQAIGDFSRQVSHACEKPVAWTGLLCEPSVNSENHLIGLGFIGQSSLLLSHPQKFLFAVPLADVDTKIDEFLIDDRLESVRRLSIAGAFYGDRSLIIFVA